MLISNVLCLIDQWSVLSIQLVFPVRLIAYFLCKNLSELYQMIHLGT